MGSGGVKERIAIESYGWRGINCMSQSMGRFGGKKLKLF